MLKKIKKAFQSDSISETVLENTAKVVQQLRKGNLRARANIDSLDNTGRFLQLVNEMAEELEGVVERNKILERSKTAWLQEMAHDIRTPLSSIELAQTTLKESFTKLSDSQKLELIDDSLNEILHTRTIVEDLLFMSLLEDSTYFSKKTNINLTTFIEKTLEFYPDRARRSSKTFLVSNLLSDSHLTANLNEALFARMLRNAADNALAYGQKIIHVSYGKNEIRSEFYMSFENDSPHLSPHEIETFGKKRAPRTNNREGKLPSSLGLGSMILSKSATYMGARLKLENSFIQEACPSVKLTITWPL